MITDPTVIDEIATVLDGLSVEELARTAGDMAALRHRRMTGGWDDDLAEILQGAYVPGDLKVYALTVGQGEGDGDDGEEWPPFDYPPTPPAPVDEPF